MLGDIPPIFKIDPVKAKCAFLRSLNDESYLRDLINAVYKMNQALHLDSSNCSKDNHHSFGLHLNTTMQVAAGSFTMKAKEPVACQTAEVSDISLLR